MNDCWPPLLLPRVDATDPHKRERHEPGPCIGCGASLDHAPEVGMERRQVFDLPPITVRVTEHQLIARRCGCGTTTCGQAPEGVTGPVQYGPRITAIILYLYVGQFLSKKRTAHALAELFGTPVSEGTIATMTRRAADRLGEFRTQIGDRIAEAAVAGFDETGLRVAGALHWVHCVRTDKYTLITCHPQRGARVSTMPVCWAVFGVSRCMMPGRRMTPTLMSSISCVARTRCASWPVWPIPPRRMPTGAGPFRPLTRSCRCRSW
jgi:transposase